MNFRIVLENFAKNNYHDFHIIIIILQKFEDANFSIPFKVIITEGNNLLGPSPTSVRGPKF